MMAVDISRLNNWEKHFLLWEYVAAEWEEEEPSKGTEAATCSYILKK